MENIINFFRTYWGYTIYGGITIGSLITFAVSNIKLLISSKGKDLSISTLKNQISELQTLAKQTQNENTALVNNIKALQISQEQKEAYYQKMQALTFKSISYLTMASKLSNEDKESLEADIQAFKQETVTAYTAKLETYDEQLTTAMQNGTTEETVKEEIVPDAIQTVVETTKKIPSLFEKYTQTSSEESKTE